MAIANQYQNYLNSLRRDVNQTLKHLTPQEGLSWLPHQLNLPWKPAVELYETKTAFTLRVELPNVLASELEILADDRSLTLRGKHHEDPSEEDQDCLFSEFYYGDFERYIPLSADIKAEEVCSELKNGVLTVTLPKVTGGETSFITVEVKHAAS